VDTYPYSCELIALMMEAARTSETLVNFYQTTRRYNPESSHLRTHRSENLKSYVSATFRSYNTCLLPEMCPVRISLGTQIILPIFFRNFSEFLQNNSGMYLEIEPPVQWVPGVLSPGVKRGRGVTLTTHPHLVPRLRMSRSYTSSPPRRLHGV
jgi:hypothetical protein